MVRRVSLPLRASYREQTTGERKMDVVLGSSHSPQTFSKCCVQLIRCFISVCLCWFSPCLLPVSTSVFNVPRLQPCSWPIHSLTFSWHFENVYDLVPSLFKVMWLPHFPCMNYRPSLSLWGLTCPPYLWAVYLTVHTLAIRIYL